MTPQQYYARVQPQLERCFSQAHYVVAAGEELLAEGWDPGFLVAVAPVEELSRFTLGKGMQVHLPVVGRRSQSVLMPLDVEVFLAGENHLLYTDKAAQHRWISETLPALRHLTGELRSRGLPYLLDYTPSGAHILWQNPIDHRAARAVADVGPLEPDLLAASPFSLHKKNQQKYGMRHLPPLVDVIGEVFDGDRIHGETQIDLVVDCMWDLGRAADHAAQFSGEIPETNDRLIDLVDEYRRGDLHAMHERFDRAPDLPRGEAVTRARHHS